MPRVVYGIRAIHRSHRIDSPPVRPDETVEAGDRPDACALCHLGGAAPSEPGALLFAGDPIQRAALAAAMGRGDAASPGPRERTALLLEAMRDDAYPAVRAIAWAGVRALVADPPPVDAFVATSSREARARAVEALATTLGIQPAPTAARATLRARASDRAIEIGE
jgi:hypothetical protein